MSRAISGIFEGDVLATRQLKGFYLRKTTGITDNFVLAADMPSFLFLVATAARDVLMPSVTQAIDGKIMTIYNEGTGTITLKTSSDAAFTVAMTVTTATPAIVMAIFGLTAVTAWKRLSIS